MPPRGLRPSGLILVDKPPGPSSFAIVREIRARTGARTGHAGTLDPFASGLLLALSGGTTRLAPWLVGLDKRYLTEIDLRYRTSTGDPASKCTATNGRYNKNAEITKKIATPASSRAMPHTDNLSNR